jgi:hypothetical protein
MGNESRMRVSKRNGGLRVGEVKGRGVSVSDDRKLEKRNALSG